jgi:hypothetical protein
MGVFRLLVVMGVLLPLLTALPNWLLLETSRIQSEVAPLEDGGVEAMPEMPWGENINEVTSLVSSHLLPLSGVREQGLRGYILRTRALGLDFFSIYATANAQQADNRRTKQNCVWGA